MTTKEYAGLNVAGISNDFDTLEEAKKYYRGHPEGTYDILKKIDGKWKSVNDL